MRKYTKGLAGLTVSLAALGMCTPVSADIIGIIDTLDLAGVVENGSQLSASGWTGYRIYLFADAASQSIASVDFATPNGVGGNQTGQYRGIFGNLHQSWIPSAGGAISTPLAPWPENLPTDSDDSHWLSFDPAMGFASSFSPLEDSNFISGATNPPYVASPLSNNASNVYGVGGLLRLAGSFTGTQPRDVSLAYIVVPILNLPEFTMEGTVTDAFGNVFTMRYIGAQDLTSFPEPSTLGIFVLGSAMLGIRRRRKRPVDPV